MQKRIIFTVVALVLIGLVSWFSYTKFNTKSLAKKTYPKVPITVVVDWELVKPVELQIFYTTEQTENFNEKHSVRKNVTQQDTHVEVIIPEDKIYKFRIDFGSQPERVLLKNVEIIADQYINFNDWYSYGYKNIEKSKVNKKNNSLTIISEHRDPYMVWSLPFVLYKNE